MNKFQFVKKCKEGVMYEKIMYVQKTKSALLQATWRRKSKGGGEICMEKELNQNP